MRISSFLFNFYLIFLFDLLSRHSRVGLDVVPGLADLVAVLAGGLAVGGGALEALGAQAQGHAVLGLAAHAEGLPQEPARVALVQSRHDLLAG